ncbi:flagellin hook IN motif-containing protein, partial [Shewanella algae]|uniref:flagellin hook IN motif-containing protein n=1 Tax=Shewanella algae TaxID=38313 RepID=UPI00313CC64A
SANGGVTITVSTAATQATLSSKGFAFATTTAGSNSSFTLNGVTFSVASSDTAQNIIDKVNQAQNQTGVAAVYNSTTNKIQF